MRLTNLPGSSWQNSSPTYLFSKQLRDRIYALPYFLWFLRKTRPFQRIPKAGFYTSDNRFQQQSAAPPCIIPARIWDSSPYIFCFPLQNSFLFPLFLRHSSADNGTASRPNPLWGEKRCRMARHPRSPMNTPLPKTNPRDSTRSANARHICSQFPLGFSSWFHHTSKTYVCQQKIRKFFHPKQLFCSHPHFSHKKRQKCAPPQMGERIRCLYFSKYSW